MEILELNNISKSFGAIKALDNVSLSLRSGEVLGLMGDNGAGKSTLIKIIAGNFKQSSGTINFENQKVEFSKPMEARDSFLNKVEEYKKKFVDKNNVPRPKHWSGFLLSPKKIEFWKDVEGRLHQRLEYSKEFNLWKKQILYP